MRIRHLVFTIGIVLLAMAPAFLVAAAVAWWYGEGDVMAFLVSAGITTASGSAGVATTRPEGSLSIREGYAVVSLTWIAAGVLGAVPYLVSGVISDPIAALFESVSGFTTTGASVLSDIEAVPHGVLFWRSLTQWLGGMGIILLGVAILPFLGVGGMHLFRAEVPGPTVERLSPRIAETAKLLWIVYAALTALLAMLLLGGGLDPFDAINHALTTMPTGGFSTWNASVAAIDSAFVHYTVILFMYLAGVNFVLHFRAASGRPHGYVRSAEWRFYTAALAAGCAGVVLLLLTSGAYSGLGAERALRDALFQVVSLGTTTGFVTADYGLWPLGAQLLLVGLMLMGGMAGSTAGGIKTMRVYLLARQTMAEVKRNLHPRAVVVTRLGEKVLEESDVLNILSFVLLFLGIFGVGVLALALLGHDLATSVGASVSAVANIGPGLGAVGPVANFGWMDPWSHGVLIALMIVGRLEVFTVLLLFHPDLWRR
jgi:trk system potassium uptake protein TrkH